MVEELTRRGCRSIFVPRSAEYDLREQSSVLKLFEKSRPQIVLHLAARCGGIGANRRSPATFFYDNAMMGLQVMEVARRFEVRKFVALGTVCAYPKNTPVPFRESDLWNGYPEDSNAPYGLAKKMSLVQAQAYRDQYAFDAIYLLPVNLFGPRDNFDLQDSHVIPALIRKCIDAERRGEREIVLWGDGSATREFLYVEEAARGIVLAAANYSGREPVNLGAGQEISIRDLADKVVRLTGYSGSIRWDAAQPNGQARRRLDVERAAECFGFRAEFDFDEALGKTIHWYRTRAPLIPNRAMELVDHDP